MIGVPAVVIRAPRPSVELDRRFIVGDKLFRIAGIMIGGPAGVKMHPRPSGRARSPDLVGYGGAHNRGIMIGDPRCSRQRLSARATSPENSRLWRAHNHRYHNRRAPRLL